MKLGENTIEAHMILKNSKYNRKCHNLQIVYRD